MNKKIETTKELASSIYKTKAKNIVFDVFDTIVHRRVHPQDVKKIASKKLVEKMGLVTTPKSIYDIRFKIEANLCTFNEIEGFDLEFNLEDFAKNLYVELSKIEDLSNVTIDQFIEIVIDVEIAVEKQVLFVDLNVVATIQELHRKGLNVYICSDFYIPRKYLEIILEPFGFNQYIKKYYVSADYKKTKRSGKLYDILINENLRKALMIGDNIHSDYNTAIEKGWNAIHIDRTFYYEKYEQYKTEFELDSIVTLKINELFNNKTDNLFSEMALTSFYFIHELYNRLQKERYQDVLFLAREGQLIEELFNIYQEKYISSDKLTIKTHYFKVSRRSTFLPSLDVLSKENFHNLFRQYINISLSDFLQSLGFGEDFIVIIAKECDVDPLNRELDFPASHAYEKLITNINFITSYEERRKAQKENFHTYLESLRLKDNSKIAIVDVGWKGTIQDNIFKTFDGHTKIDGYYFGIVTPNTYKIKNNKKGLLFDIENWHDFYGVFNENRSLFEVVFAADHGSAIGYEKNSDGSIEVELEDFSEEKEFYDTQITPIIGSVRNNFIEICAILSLKVFPHSLLHDLTIKSHLRMIYLPTDIELDWFNSIYHIENFGVFEKNVFNRLQNTIFLKIKNYLAYRKRPDTFLKDVVWPAAELKKHGLGFVGNRYGKKQVNYYQGLLENQKSKL